MKLYSPFVEKVLDIGAFLWYNYKFALTMCSGGRPPSGNLDEQLHNGDCTSVLPDMLQINRGETMYFISKNVLPEGLEITSDLVRLLGKMPEELRGTKQGDVWLNIENTLFEEKRMTKGTPNDSAAWKSLRALDRQMCENPDALHITKWTEADSPDSTEAIADGATKYDNGKHMGAILYEYFPRALEQVSEVSTFGAKKYSRGGWAHVPNGIERYTDAMHRHFLQEAKGELIDDDSGLSHAAHAAWGALCRLELQLRENEDER